jgi:hypothetical protein
MGGIVADVAIEGVGAGCGRWGMGASLVMVRGDVDADSEFGELVMAVAFCGDVVCSDSAGLDITLGGCRGGNRSLGIGPSLVSEGCFW